MADKEKEKEVKQLQKEIAQLYKLYPTLELSPCKCDRDLMEKEQALRDLRNEIHELEKMRDRLLYTWWVKA